MLGRFARIAMGPAFHSDGGEDFHETLVSIEEGSGVCIFFLLCPAILETWFYHIFVTDRRHVGHRLFVPKAISLVAKFAVTHCS